MKNTHRALLGLLLLNAAVACEEETEPKCDATPQKEDRLHRNDANGRRAETRVMIGEKGHVWAYAYDGEDRLVSRALTALEDAPEEGPRRVEARAFDAEGRITGVISTGDQGDKTIQLAYDAEGRLVSAETRRNGELIPETQFAKPLPFDPEDEIPMVPAQGQRMDVWHPVVPDAEVERLTFTYAAPGEPELDARDIDGDGEVDERRLLRLVRDGDQEQDDMDWDLDGQFDLRVVKTFGAAGEVLEEQTLRIFPDREVLTLHTVSTPDKSVTESFDEADGRLVKHERITFDAAGRRVLKEDDNDADGETDWRKTYVYDAAGNRTSETRDRDADGVPDQVWTYTYADGLLTSEARLEAGGDKALCDAE